MKIRVEGRMVKLSRNMVFFFIFKEHLVNIPNYSTNSLIIYSDVVISKDGKEVKKSRTTFENAQKIYLIMQNEPAIPI
jgi:hypothetical protein